MRLGRECTFDFRGSGGQAELFKLIEQETQYERNRDRQRIKFPLGPLLNLLLVHYMDEDQDEYA